MCFKKGFVVLLLEKEFLSRAPTVHDVIDGSRILNTKRPSHDNGYYQRRALTVNKRFDRMPRKRCNLPVKVRSGELSVHPGSKDPVLWGDSQAEWIEKTP